MARNPWRNFGAFPNQARESSNFSFWGDPAGGCFSRSNLTPAGWEIKQNKSTHHVTYVSKEQICSLDFLRVTALTPNLVHGWLYRMMEGWYFLRGSAGYFPQPSTTILQRYRAWFGCSIVQSPTPKKQSLVERTRHFDQGFLSAYGGITYGGITHCRHPVGITDWVYHPQVCWFCWWQRKNSTMQSGKP